VSARFLILVALYEQSPRHAYVLQKRLVEALALDLSHGTLFDNLRRLEAEGCIEPVPDPAAGADRRHRIPYVLTAAGKRSVEDESRRLGALGRWLHALGLAPNGTAGEPGLD
jgi:DNA-binding PadR family transcriptional regulator